MRSEPIYCPTCDVVCGRDYPDTGPSYSSGGEPGFREGPGEDFVYKGEWYCSAECRDVAIAADKEEEDDNEGQGYRL